jgi:tetratricopeptide (TPR) repeat protein
MSQKMDSVAAATKAFGDLKRLQSELEGYIKKAMFGALQFPGTTEVDESAFTLESIGRTQADAFRADFLAYSGRTEDARPLAQQVLREEPENVSACETLGYLAFAQRNLEEAGKWYAKAVSLNTQSYLSHYYFASILLTGSRGEEQPRAEASLRAAVKLNPSFAPAYDELGVYYGMRGRNLDEAHMLSLQAVQLEPSNMAYRLNSARILMRMGRGSDAVLVIRAAMKIARSPEATASGEKLLAQAEEYAAAQEKAEESSPQLRKREQVQGSAGETVVSPDAGARAEAQPDAAELPRLARVGPAGGDLRGVRLAVSGTVNDVQCLEPARLDLKVETGGHTFVLHSENYFKVSFTALNFTPQGELKPCTDLNGVTARIEYVQPAGKQGQIVSVEMRR